MLRFVSNVPALEVILQPARIERDSVTGYDARHTPTISAKFRSGFYQSPSQEVDDMLLRHIAKVRDNVNMTLHFNILPPDVKQAQARADELSLGKLPGFSASAGKNVGRHLAAKSASAISSDMKRDLEEAGFDLSAGERQDGAKSRSAEVQAIMADNEAKANRIKELEEQIAKNENNAPTDAPAPQGKPASDSDDAASKPAKAKKPAAPVE